MFVHYCSSDTWSGTRAADEETGGYIFHGRHVFEVRLGVTLLFTRAGNEGSQRIHNHGKGSVPG